MNYVHTLKRLDLVNRAYYRVDKAYFSDRDDRYKDVFFALYSKRNELQRAIKAYIEREYEDRDIRYRQIDTAIRLLKVDTRYML